MTVLAKLFFLGIEKEVQNVQIVYQRIINHKTGRPTTEVQGGYLQLSFESSKDDEVFEYYSGKPSERIPGDERFCFLNLGELVFYPGSYDNPPVKRYRFSDATITNIRVKFTATGESSMTTCITISPAIQNYGALLVKDWNESYLPQSTDNYVPQNEEEEKKEEVKCIAWLERLETYKGEFGFDWMRDNYKDICENYEELKKEYEQITIEGETYFVPWLSMFPNQENVSLNLKVKITEGKPKNDDVVKLPSKNGIRFEPNEVKIKDIQKGEVTIKVFCDTPLNKDTKIELLNKENHRVGKITVVKNDEILTLPVHFVKVKGNEPDNTYNERTFHKFDKGKIIDFFNKTSLNQAFINVDLIEVSEMVIDIEELISKNVLKRPFGNIPQFHEGNSKYVNTLETIFKKKHPNFKGVIFFLSAIPQDGTQGGHSAVYPRESNSIIIVPDQVSINEKKTFVHELGHVLGLLHSFKDGFKEDLNRLVKDKKASIKKYSLKSEKKIRYRGEIMTIGEYIKELENNIIQLESLIDSNSFVFKQSGTDNYMDYYISEPLSFNKWQWDLMRNETKQYHGK